MAFGSMLGGVAKGVKKGGTKKKKPRAGVLGAMRSKRTLPKQLNPNKRRKGPVKSGAIKTRPRMR